MTSKRLFVNLLKENSKRRLWTIALSVTGSFFAQVVFAILMFGRYSERLANDLTNIDDIRINFYNSVGGMGNEIMQFVAFALPVILAIQGYYYLLDSKQTDLYYSLPVKREKLFDINNICGILIFAVPYLVFNLITVLMGLSKGYATLNTILLYPLNALVIILSFIMLYEICTLAVVLTGNVIVAALGCGVFYFLGAIWKTIHTSMMSTFFVSYWNESAAYDNRIDGSPLGLIFDTIHNFQGNKQKEIAFYTFDAAFGMFWIIILAVLAFCLARILIKRRPAEAAGRAMAFAITKPVLKILISCLGGLGAGLVLYYMGNASSLALFIFGIVCGIIVVHVVMETIYEFDFKACLKHYGSLVASMVIAVAVLGIFFFDIVGYESWQPMPSRVESVAIGDDMVYAGLMAPYSKTIDDTSLDYYQSTANGMSYALYNMKLTDIETVEKLTRQGAIFAKEYHKAAFKNGSGVNSYFGVRGYPENNDENADYQSFEIQLNLKNGKKVRRVYYIDMNDEENLSAFKDIYSSDEYKKGKFPALSIAKGEINVLEAETLAGEKKKMLNDDEMSEFIKIYSEELSQQSFEDLSTQTPSVTLYGAMDEGRAFYSNQKYNFYIFDSFTKTTKFLEEHGVPVSWWDGSKDISSVKVKYESWDKEKDQEIYAEWESADAKEIESVLQYEIPTDNYNATGRYHTYDGESNGTTTVEMTSNTSSGTYSDYLVQCAGDELPKTLKYICFSDQVDSDASVSGDNRYGWVKCVNNG